MKADDGTIGPDLPDDMLAVVTTGTGGHDRLDYTRIPLPRPGEGEVLVRVLAAGINNTDINTRLGWYSSSVAGGTGEADAGDAPPGEGGWNGATPFPLVQGTDCCGTLVAVGARGDASNVGRRVLVRPCMHPDGFDAERTLWLGSDVDGAFAQYVRVPATEAFPVDCDWSDAELASMPCACGTAENMIERAGVSGGSRVLVVGASGGVGSAAVQLAKRRGAHVIGVTGDAKRERVLGLGADETIDREDDPLERLGERSVDVVVDNVAGAAFGTLLRVLKPRGRYVTSGAIAGPVVELDLRRLYLNDVTLIGTTAWDEAVFPNLVGYIERGEIRPVLERTYPLADIVAAQRAFERKEHVGKLVLIPPA